MWERIMHLFGRRPCAAEDRALSALLARTREAGERAGRAADAVTDSSDRHRARVEAINAEIVAHTEAGRRSRSQPPTSQVRAVVEEMLAGMDQRAARNAGKFES